MSPLNEPHAGARLPVDRRVCTFARGHWADGNIRVRHAADQATWIWHPHRSGTDTAFLRFTLDFTLPEEVELLLHVTADQRFQLRCDGLEMTYGPDRCDIAHWSLQSLKMRLAPGQHRMEAIVWLIGGPLGEEGAQGFSAKAPMAQMTWRGGFLLACEGEYSESITTGKAPWRVEDLTPAVMLSGIALPGYHDIGPSFHFDVAKWNGTTSCVTPNEVWPPLVGNLHGVRRPGWCLYPTPLPEQRRESWRGGRIRALRRNENRADPWTEAEAGDPDLSAWNGLLAGTAVQRIPPNASIAILWDLENYCCGYPEFEIEGGAEAAMEWTWAEACYEENSAAHVAPNSRKGNRNEIVGKVLVGIEDRWRLGAKGTASGPMLWWRSGRYVRVLLASGDEELVVRKLGVRTTGYPLKTVGAWTSSDAELNRLMSLFRRAIECAAHELWVDTPYYEQMSYVGDSRLSALFNYAWHSDIRLSRRTLQLYDWSRNGTGFVSERYPSRWRQESITFSLLWPLMIRDFAWWRDERDFVISLLPGMRAMLAEVEALEGKNGLLFSVPGWSFVDWVPEWMEGCGPGVREGDSSLINLHHVLALQACAEIEDAVGDALLAERCRKRARRIGEEIVARYWDVEQQLLKDTATGESALPSEHAQALALLARVLDPAMAKACVRHLCEPRVGWAAASIYGSFYVLEALRLCGEEEAFHRRLSAWRRLLELGFVSTPEQGEPARSDAHAWGAHPGWHALTSIAGVRPLAAGFSRVEVRPYPGNLSMMECDVAHPRGLVRLKLTFSRHGAVGSIELPGGISGEFVWHGHTVPLHEGINFIESA